MNRCVLIGRLVRDPELRFTAGNGTAVCSFTLAVDRQFKNKETGKKEADFIQVVIWNKLAEAVANNLTKGRLVAVSGRIQTRTYEAQDGTKRYVTEVVADDCQFLDYRKDNNAGNSQTSKYKGPDDTGHEEDFFPVNGNEDIPF